MASTNQLAPPNVTSLEELPLLLAGELANSSASDLATLRKVWPRLVELELNTVLAPIYWELIEPEEGAFDFTLVDELLRLARLHHQHLVLLWFGAWKNSMSCYAPGWVKRDTERFCRARLHDGTPLEMLSAFSTENLAIDCRAFGRLMAYLREKDATERTVVMVQVENEVGMLEQARDTCREANQAFHQPVSAEFLKALETMNGEVARRMHVAGRMQGGSWPEVFGESIETEEIFQAYFLAKFVDTVAATGKSEYALPMYVNAALNRPGAKPGHYPSAGPLPHLFDVWRFAAPNLDLLAPDIYLPDFADWCKRYDCSGNRLFIPEATNNADCAVHALYAMGAHQALGFSPFTVEAIDPRESMLPDCYRALRLLNDEIMRCRKSDAVRAVVLTQGEPLSQFELGGYRLSCSHDYTWEWSGPGRLAAEWPKAGALVLATGPDEFLLLGTGVIVTFAPAQATRGRVGIFSIDEVVADAERFVTRRRLNGDESHQGRHLRLPALAFNVQTIRLYQYR